MKYTIASLIACLSASSVYASHREPASTETSEASSEAKSHNSWWWWHHQPAPVIEKKQAYCHFTEDYYDWSKPRFLFDLYQRSKDGEVDSFKVALQSYNVGADGDMLSVNSYGEADCAGDATTVVDGGITVHSRWH